MSSNFNFAKTEEEILSSWTSHDCFATSNDLMSTNPTYTFFDGPPFATGLPHYGHILASTIKDTITRYFIQHSYNVSRRFGWDCHGLPVEYEIDKSHGINGRDDVLQLYGVRKYNTMCRDIVLRYVGEWEVIVKRLGRWIDFENGYKTMDTSFMESVWSVFKMFFDRGLVYRGYRVMPFSTKCGTPLSNFEANQNYKEVCEVSVVVKFEVLGFQDITDVQESNQCANNENDNFEKVIDQSVNNEKSIDQSVNDGKDNDEKTIDQSFNNEKNNNITINQSVNDGKRNNKDDEKANINNDKHFDDKKNNNNNDKYAENNNAFICHKTKTDQECGCDIGNNDDLDIHDICNIGKRILNIDLKPRTKPVFCLVWTTTPWTLPSNCGLAVNQNFDYSLIECESEILIILSEKVNSYFNTNPKLKKGKTIKTIKGQQLIGFQYIPPYNYFNTLRTSKHFFKIMHGDFIEKDMGTGIVHCAPGFGEDDYKTFVKNNLIEENEEVPCPVNDAGKFTKEIVDYEGKYVKDCDKDIIKDLDNRNLVFVKSNVTHRYPFCWRSDTPLIYKVVPNWFIKVKEFSKDLMEQNEKVNWVPESVKYKKFHNWLEGAKDWSISRNRFWGTPVPIWADEEYKRFLCIGNIKELEEMGNVEVFGNISKEKIDDPGVNKDENCNKERIDNVNQNKKNDNKEGRDNVNQKKVENNKEGIDNVSENKEGIDNVNQNKEGRDNVNQKKVENNKEGIDNVSENKEGIDNVNQNKKNDNKEGRDNVNQKKVDHNKEGIDNVSEYKEGIDNVNQNKKNDNKEGRDNVNQKKVDHNKEGIDNVSEYKIENNENGNKEGIDNVNQNKKNDNKEGRDNVNHKKVENNKEGINNVSEYKIENNENGNKEGIDNVNQNKSENNGNKENNSKKDSKIFDNKTDNKKGDIYKITDIHREYIDHIEIIKDGVKYKRVDEVLDCWFESGSMPYAQIHYPISTQELNIPADFIGEGVDQTRGWFYTLTVISSILFNKPAFKNVIVNGIVLSEDGKKMSKRLKNYPDPSEIIHQYGSDSLRMALISSPVVVAENMKFGEGRVREIFKGVMIPWYNSLKFYLDSKCKENDGGSNDINKVIENKGSTVGNKDKAQNIGMQQENNKKGDEQYEVIQCKVHIKDEAGNKVIQEELQQKLNNCYDQDIKGLMMDEWLINRINILTKYIEKEMESYHLNNILPQILIFIDDISNWYIRMNRNEIRNGKNKILGQVLSHFSIIMAPFTPFFSEYSFQEILKKDPLNLNIKRFDNLKYNSVHYQMYPKIINTYDHPFDKIKDIITAFRFLRESNRISLKRPLREGFIIINDHETTTKYIDIIKKECNLLNIHLKNENEYTFEESWKPNFLNIKENKKEKIECIRKMNANQINEIIKNDYININNLNINKNEIIYNKIIKENKFPFKSGDGFCVILNINEDKETKEMGDARELFAFVQKMRKNMGISVDEKRSISIENSYLCQIIQKYYGNDVVVNVGNECVGELNYLFENVEYKLKLYK